MNRASGAVTADDAMWLSLKILRLWPALAAVVADRFDEVLTGVDLFGD